MRIWILDNLTVMRIWISLACVWRKIKGSALFRV